MNRRQITNPANLRSGDRCFFVDGRLGTIAGFSLQITNTKGVKYLHKDDPVIVMDEGDINIFSTRLFTIVDMSNNEYQRRLNDFDHIESFNGHYEIEDIQSALYEKDGKMYIQGFPNESFAIFNIKVNPIYAVTCNIFTSEAIAA